MASDDKSILDQALGLFGDVRRGEGARLLVLAANLLLLLLAYYLLKTIREPLVLAVKGGGAELKMYASAAQAVVLVGIATAFGWLASRLKRMTLLAVVILFFVSNLVLFFGLYHTLPDDKLALGISFYIWIGCFSVMILSQFWAFANELHTKEQGERLFGIIAGGSAIGAVIGAKLGKPLYKMMGPYPLMLIAAGILLVCLGLTYLAFKMSRVGRTEEEHREHEDPLEKSGGWKLILHDRYLLFVALLSLFANWVNTTGEYILDRVVLDAATAKVGHDEAARSAFVAAFKSDYFTYTNLVVLVLQLFAVSRLVRYIGIRRALFILPVLALGGYTTMAFIPVITVVLIGKVIENGTDYSLEKTVEQMLYLVTSRQAKYKAKSITDTFAVRLGDVMTALLVFIGARLHLHTRTFILMTIVLVLGWFGVALVLGRLHAEKEKKHEADEEPQPAHGGPLHAAASAVTAP